MKKFWKKTNRTRNVAIAAASQASTTTSASSTAAATLSSTTAKETTLANASPVFALLKDGGEMLKDVPYLKAIAGILNTIFRIWEEIMEVDSLTEELLESVKRRSEKLLRSLQELAKQGRTQLVELEDDLGDYKQLLERIADDLHAMQDLGSVSRWLQRTESRDRIHGHMRRLSEFSEIFSISRLTTIVTQVDALVRQAEKTGEVLSPGDQTLFKDGLPPTPRHVFGRESEVSEMKKILLQHPAPRMAILGPGGMGKTTVAQQLMNDKDVLERFVNPLFVLCETRATTITVLHAIADVLHIPPDQRGPSLQTNVIQQLRRHPGCLLCLDNFEDAWDPPATRHAIEELLATFDGIQSTGIIITMRGTEKPHGLSWTHPQPSALEPLEDGPALALFEAVSHCLEEGVSELLKAVDNVPLAVKLLGRLVEEEGLDYVLLQWKTNGLKVVDRGDASDTRTTSVTASIELSLSSPRISTMPFVLQVLGILAVLPNGLSSSMIATLQANLPPGVDLRRVLQALKRIALCYLDSNGRYRLLAPIRQHIQTTTLLDPPILDGLTRTFFDLVIHKSHTHYYDSVAPELANIYWCVVSDPAPWSETRILACQSYLWWGGALGNRDTPLALEALSHATSTILKVKCRFQLSQLLFFSFRYREAREYLVPTLSLDIGDPYWEGQVQLAMGDIERMLYEHRDSETFFRQAVDLFKKANRLDWVGHTLLRLGELVCDSGRISEAEEFFLKSLELARNLGHMFIQAEGNALRGLGDIYRLTNRMSEAVDFLRQAIDCQQRSHSLQGEAIALQSLGQVQYARGDYDESEKCFLTSRVLCVRITDSFGEATASRWLGRVYTQMDGRLDWAEQHFRDALLIIQKNHLQDLQPSTFADLGNLFSRHGHSSKANMHWVISIAFYLRRLHKSTWKQVIPLCAQIQKAAEEGPSLMTDSPDSVHET